MIEGHRWGAAPAAPAYTYRAVVRSVYDGDTIRLDIDLGFSTWVRNESMRLVGVDAPEIRGEERPQGLIVRDWMQAQLPVDTPVLVQTFKDRKGKYGRYLVEIWKGDLCINAELIERGLATAYVE